MAKIMIVDDSTITRKLLRIILEKLNHQIVAEAESGEQALIQYRKFTPDIVTLDLVMHDIGGIETAQKILSFYPSAKIIIISAHSQNDLKKELIDIGVKHLVIKPINEAKLSEAIQSILTGTGSNIVIEDSENKKRKMKMQKYLQDIAMKINEIDLFEVNELQNEDMISVSHFSLNQPIKATILDKKVNVLTLKFIKDTPSFMSEDPITLCFRSKSEFKICEANVIDMNPKEKIMKIHVLKVNLLEDKNLDEKFPTSLHFDLKQELNNKKQSAILKKIGSYEMQFKAKVELAIGEKIIFNLYLDEKVLTLNAEITSIVQMQHDFEYDIKITFIDLNSKKFLNLFIQKLKETHENSILN